MGIEQTTCFFPGDHGGTSDCTTAGTWELFGGMLPAVKSQKYCCKELFQENLSPLLDGTTSLHFNRLRAVRNGNPRALYVSVRKVFPEDLCAAL